MCSKNPMFADRGDYKSIEEGAEFSPKFDADGLIPVIATDHATNQVLMVAYMNETSLAKTIECGQAVYYSRSRQKLWHKGEESGNVQKVKQMFIDCDQDCIVLKVEQVGGAACHTGYRSCFFREVDIENAKATSPVGLVTTDEDKLFDPEKVYGKK